MEVILLVPEEAALYAFSSGLERVVESQLIALRLVNAGKAWVRRPKILDSLPGKSARGSGRLNLFWRSFGSVADQAGRAYECECQRSFALYLHATPQ